MTEIRSDKGRRDRENARQGKRKKKHRERRKYREEELFLCA